MQISKYELFGLSPALPCQPPSSLKRPLSAQRHLQTTSRCSKLAQTLDGPFQREDLILLCWSNRQRLWFWWAPDPHQGPILTAKPSSPSPKTSLKPPKSSKPLCFFCVKQIPQASGEFLYNLGEHNSFACVRKPKAKSWHALHPVIMFPIGGLWLQRVSQAFVTLATPRGRWMNAVLISQRLSVIEESGSASQTHAGPPSHTIASGTAGRKASIHCMGSFRGFWQKHCVGPSDQTLLFGFITRLFLIFFLEEN